MAGALLEGIYYGALAAMLLHGAAVWWTLRERTQLWFVLLLGALLLSTWVWGGTGAELLPEGVRRAGMVVSDAWAAVAAVAFTRSWLETARRSPRLDRALRAVAVAAALAIPLSAPPTWAIGLEWIGLVALCAPPFLLYVGAVSWRAGFAPARAYLAAVGLLFAGLALEVAADWTPLHADVWTEIPTYLGILGMAFVFSHGLARRHRESLRDRERLELARRWAEAAALRDGLTGIANRRRFDDVLEAYWRRALHADERVALVLIDVDFFKPFNDGCGHSAGDDCLRRVAEALASAPGDPACLVARFGGEEFAALLPGQGEAEALHLAERMRRAVAELAIPHPASEAAGHVTISAGVASLVPGEGEDAKLLVDAADRALYAAKEAGRNRVTSA